MSQKTKTIKTSTETLGDIAQQMGFVLMTLAATVGMLELPEHPNSKVITPNQPSFAFATNSGEENNNPLRREREESAPHYISYNVAQRTPGRTGRV